MSHSEPVPEQGTRVEQSPTSRWSWVTEDWLAVIAGLGLLALVLVGAIPDWLVP
ncbi:hypothetical protein IU474_28660 [Nocardia otitidiscaviarum]|uniref:hypothetical protein n=1 Tax=Nocardia otitidiscaviarum TaxID=1823 RepID=UPI00189370CB|nr:hypothetical protein [Nocardia otitidiscaviarum]MBF6241024.1 hypothetical protein [Nocardia otitidiscaviarum]